MTNTHRYIPAVIIAAVFLLSAAAGFLAPVQMMELKVRNLMFDLRGPQETSHSDIVIIEMSQSADDEIPYKYPWPAYVYGKLIDNLNRAGVKAIGIDVIFDQPDYLSPENDSIFAAALGKHGNVVLASRALREVQPGRSGIGRELSRMVSPHPMLSDANPNPSGLVNTDRDADEFIRRYLLYHTVMDQTRYSLALEMARLLTPAAAEEPGSGTYQSAPAIETDQSEGEPAGDSFRIESRSDALSFGPFTIPVFHHNTMLINYYGGSRTFDFLGFEEIIDDEDFVTTTEMAAFETNLFDDPEYGILHQDILKDNIVLVGATMPELQDIHPVPVKDAYGRNQMAGVEIHAHALQTILDQNYLKVASTPLQTLFLLMITCLTVFTTRRLSVQGGLAAMAAVLGFWFMFAAWLFISPGIVVFYLSPVIATLAGYGGVTAHNYFREQREKQRIRELFASYVSPELVSRMVESRHDFRPGGREAELTAMFTDITGFSALAEKLTPARLIRLMNQYLERMTALIVGNEGTLDKYIGDAVMAFYGAPLPVGQHAAKACESAVRMQKALSELRSQWASSGEDYPPEIHHLRMRIGINTGRMVVGNMGSSLRFNYTILGDQVNIAARCESACKIYGVEIIVTEETLRHLDNGEGKDNHPFLFRCLDLIRVRGRSEPIGIYQLIGLRDEQSPAAKEAVRRYERAVSLYRERNWKAAAALFETVLEHEEIISGYQSTLSPSSLYIGRCERFCRQPPDPLWEGVFEQK